MIEGTVLPWRGYSSVQLKEEMDSCIPKKHWSLALVVNTPHGHFLLGTACIPQGDSD